MWHSLTTKQRLISVIHVKERPLLLLLLVLDGIELVDAWSVVGGVSAEGDFEGLEEGVHTSQQRLGRVG